MSILSAALHEAHDSLGRPDLESGARFVLLLALLMPTTAIALLQPPTFVYASPFCGSDVVVVSAPGASLRDSGYWRGGRIA